MGLITASAGLKLEPDVSPYATGVMASEPNLIDGSRINNATTNPWSSDYAYGLDLGSAKTVYRLKIYATTYSISSYGMTWPTMVVFSSSDNSAWSSVSEIVVNSAQSLFSCQSVQIDLTGGVTAQYFKIVATSQPSGYNQPFVTEVEAYDTETDPTLLSFDIADSLSVSIIANEGLQVQLDLQMSLSGQAAAGIAAHDQTLVSPDIDLIIPVFNCSLDMDLSGLLVPTLTGYSQGEAFLAVDLPQITYQLKGVSQTEAALCVQIPRFAVQMTGRNQSAGLIAFNCIEIVPKLTGASATGAEMVISLPGFSISLTGQRPSRFTGIVLCYKEWPQ